RDGHQPRPATRPQGSVKINSSTLSVESGQAQSPATVRTYFIGLKIFYRWAVREELMTRNPMAAIDEPQVPDRAPAIVTESDLRKLLTACAGRDFRDRRDNAMIRVMLEPGGPRRSELASMTMDGLDMDNDLIRLHGKGDRIRYMPYSGRTGLALAQYMQLREKHRHSDSEAVWLGRFGPMTHWAVAQILEVRCKQAGVSKIKPHQLRHTSADRWFANDGSENDAMVLYGWRSRTMLSVYGRSNAVARAHEAARRKSLGDRF
ncbi:tyrosine-type recombinase/integrase, partial [Actinoplanes sp. NPDC024001]|uniref:tyrosine-type recombinase/integrase n=1 Tax=Actinoplanes sp. NPDC024001 TaxID=3154598 RepID=UPI0033F13541